MPLGTPPRFPRIFLRKDESGRRKGRTTRCRAEKTGKPRPAQGCDGPNRADRAQLERTVVLLAEHMQNMQVGALWF